MPIYEYRCNSCRRKSTLFVRGFSPPADARCTSCGSEDLTRLFSSFAIGKSEMSIYEDVLSDTNLVRGLERNDPRALAEWSKKMSKGIGEEITPEYEEITGRMEAGEWPTELMKPKEILAEESE